ncbi:hypothetical protein [Nocardia miyunensis]|uniref:hypothetical protein n=1 Tax=Nocardia miyunensis TaxID=282684 RepID=UPI000831BB83|nr:hypothetical protein [Nocardia miyunensis]
MRFEPTAFAWINPETSLAPEWDRAQIQRLARHLGYQLIWPRVESVVPLVDQIRTAEVDIVITPAPNHLTAITLNAIMSVVNVETVCPRLTFARWPLPSGHIG